MFAGSLQGVTQTLSLAIYEQFDVDFDVALAIGAELVIISAFLLLAVKLVPHGHARTHPRPSPSLLSASVAATLGRETLALVGPSGAGKSSVLRAIAGLLRPERGRIALGARRLARHGARGSTCRPSAARSGSSSRSTRSSRTSTCAATSPSADRERVDELLERFRISHLAQARPARPLWRRAAAGRACAGARPRPGGAAARRAALGARRAHRASRPRASSPSCWPSCGCRRCSSRTTSRTRRRSPTASA